MLLAVDVGNTDTVLGVFDGTAMVVDFRIHTEARASGAELGLLVTALLRGAGVDPAAITAVAVSNVVPDLSRSLDELAHRNFGCDPLVVGPGIRTGIRILYDDPSQVGGDRIANAIAVQHRYGGPAIICDFGTATSVDAIDAAGDYLGGAIAPGILVSHEALVERAARLSRVDFAAPDTVLGRNTRVSMQAGLVFGYAGLVEGLVTRMRREVGADAKLILTGGLAPLMAGLIPGVHATDESLTLVGLRLLYELNAG
ncbi:MAG TPA: type III pantothenate kinase [Candidatus Binatia bacterium]|nr:type III pantothenate kinase [Candidatus Binatia bacterium]